MVSKLLVRASRSRTLERAVVTNSLARRIALRFVAGETLPDGIAVARYLADQRRAVSLDLVGEHVDDLEAARAAAEAYTSTLRAIEQHELPAGISVKPSQLGATIDQDAAFQLLSEIAKEAGRVEAHVTLDMEDSSTTDATVTLVERLHADGHDHVGCALQSYLKRTPEDVQRLSRIGASVRLCKGAYAEPAAKAHQRREDVDRAYERCATQLLEHGTYPRFATHDHRLMGYVRREARRLGRTPHDYEFQLLYGVRTDVQRRLVDVGEHVCVYVPFGDAWYPYFVRRLAERPANLLFLLRALRS